MTTELKPGKWKLTDFGTEVIVLHITDTTRITTLFTNGGAVRTLEPWEFENAEYLGPAVIGEVPMDSRAYWILRAGQMDHKRLELEHQCKQLEAETVETRELLEQSEERCEELAKELEESDEAFKQRAHGGVQYGSVRERAGDQMMPYWQSGVRCEVDGDLVIHRYKSVTVMVRGEREAVCYLMRSYWHPSTVETCGQSLFNRDEAEAWCRQQMEPKWREATEGDKGKPCRVRDHESETWSGDKRTLIGRNENIIGGPWATVSASGSLSGWRYCEVQD